MGILKTFGSEVKRRRTSFGLSQEELAHLCDLHRTYIGSIERGERNISLQNITVISKALKCSSSELLKCLDGDVG